MLRAGFLVVTLPCNRTWKAANRGVSPTLCHMETREPVRACVSRAGVRPVRDVWACARGVLAAWEGDLGSFGGLPGFQWSVGNFNTTGCAVGIATQGGRAAQRKRFQGVCIEAVGSNTLPLGHAQLGWRVSRIQQSGPEEHPSQGSGHRCRAAGGSHRREDEAALRKTGPAVYRTLGPEGAFINSPQRAIFSPHRTLLCYTGLLSCCRPIVDNAPATLALGPSSLVCALAPTTYI